MAALLEFQLRETAAYMLLCFEESFILPFHFRLTTFPVPRMPDPEAQFIFEVDALAIRLGVLLSQQDGGNQSFHPYAYFSL